MRLVRRIGKMLRFEANGGMLVVACSTMPGEASIKKIAAVNLHTGLCGIYPEASATWSMRTNKSRNMVGQFAQHIAMIELMKVGYVAAL